MNDTKNMSDIILKKTATENNIFKDIIFTKLFISDDRKRIYTGCTGGWCPDTLYHMHNTDSNMWFSFYLLENLLLNFNIHESEYIEEHYDGLIGIEYVYPTLEIESNIENFKKLYNILYESDRTKKLIK